MTHKTPNSILGGHSQQISSFPTVEEKVVTKSPGEALDAENPRDLEIGDSSQVLPQFLDGRPAPSEEPQTFDGQAYPAQNFSLGWKIIFFFTTCSAQLLVQAQSAAVFIPINDIGKWLGTDDSGQLSWMAASWGLTIGMFLIASGRLGDMYQSGLGILYFPYPFDVCRALAGTGSAMALPNAAALMGRTFPPGKMRNIGFSLIGATAPIGFATGGLIAGALATQFGTVRWTFWVFSIITATFLISALYILPADEPRHPFGLAFKYRSQKFDYIGTLLLCIALGLFNFAWNQSVITGWQEPYVIVTLIISIISAVLFYFWERKMGVSALIPTEVLGRTSSLVYLSLFVGWSSLGIWDLYFILFLRNIREAPNSMTIAIQFLPIVPIGITAALIVPTLMAKFRGHIIFLVAMVCFILGNLFAALAPPSQTYWGFTFFSIITLIWGPDLSFATGSLIVSNAVPRQFQGVAGGMVAMITTYAITDKYGGISVGLGFGGTIEKYAAGTDGTLLEKYRAAFYLGTALSALGMIVVGLFVRMPKQAY